MKQIDFLEGLAQAANGAMLTFGKSYSVMSDDLHSTQHKRRQEPLPAGHFSLGQSFPNPHYGLTTVPVTLSVRSNLSIELYSLAGIKMKSIFRPDLRPGDHTILIDFAALGLPSGDYIYQLQATNSYGVFRHSKMMKAAE